jgi:hypothetical protein
MEKRCKGIEKGKEKEKKGRKYKGPTRLDRRVATQIF